MIKNLVIVESPAKAKTIEGYLGKDFVVKSSYGHVRDLPKGNNSIDIKNGYKPKYEVSEDKKQVVNELKKLAKEADMVWLATDDDREGEAISWHLKEALGLDEAHIQRIVFREITKPAIMRAIEQPRRINYDLVNAQQARRVLDRLVGFEISPILWRKIRNGLSAGRVQSVAVRVIVEREREIEAFNSQSYFKVTAQFSVGNKVLNAELAKNLPTEADAQAFLQRVIPGEFSVKNLEVKPAKRSPAPPFTTSTLQQEASRKLGMSVSQTMVLAQRLYEAGHISYMRTDSVNLSETAIQGATAEIKSAYGENFVKVRHYKTKSEGAQEAHEAIRPTNFAAHSTGKDRDEKRLYELIWKRAIASQMAEAELERTIVTIGISTTPENLSATGEVIKFEGFLKVYIESTDSDEEEEKEGEQAGLLPPLTVGQKLDLSQMKARQRYTQAPPRYTEAALVKKLEEMGIGRPSTYAPTISTIMNREYVTKEYRDGKERAYKEIILNAKREISAQAKTEITGADKGKLFPTDIGTIVNDFLVLQFPDVVDFHFTAEIEEKFDHIAHGSLEWSEMIDKFYLPFHSKVEAGEQIQRSAVGMSRELGPHPETGQKVIVRLGRYGPIAQIGEAEGETKPLYANLKKDQRLETITMEEALELFRLPRNVGEYLEKPLVAAVGKFGPYIRHDGKFYSIPKGEDPLVISEERAIELILEKQLVEANRLIKSFPEDETVKVLNGRWGPYIAYGDQNVKIPKGVEAADLTMEKILELVAAQGDSPKRPMRGRAGAAKAKPAAKKAAPKKAAAPKAEKAVAEKKPAAKKAATPKKAKE